MLDSQKRNKAHFLQFVNQTLHINILRLLSFCSTSSICKGNTPHLICAMYERILEIVHFLSLLEGDSKCRLRTRLKKFYASTLNKVCLHIPCSLSTQIILNLHATELLMRNATPPDPHFAVVFNFNLL